jgi:hypothetical protein
MLLIFKFLILMGFNKKGFHTPKKEEKKFILFFETTSFSHICISNA